MHPRFDAVIAAFLLIVTASFAGRALAADRPSGPLHKTRSAVMARGGMAATSQPLATSAAIRVLQSGGNAVDAAIAANAVLGVVEPMSCGIGGDLFAIVWDAKSKKLYGLNASGRAPGSATIEFYRSKGLTLIPETGPLSWSVPGCVDGWDQLRSRFGSKPWADLLAPAIGYAEAGFPVSEIIAASWKGSEPKLAKVPTSLACFLPDGHAPKPGTVFRNPALARSLRAIVRDGRDSFYRGELARAIVDYSKSAGGLFDYDDFERHTSTWVEPVSTNYRGYDVWELPPNGRGQEARLRRPGQILHRPRVRPGSRQ
jgi:gamma-glutamyltranspeptidase/glutathione hydrolase